MRAEIADGDKIALGVPQGQRGIMQGRLRDLAQPVFARDGRYEADGVADAHNVDRTWRTRHRVGQN